MDIIDQIKEIIQKEIKFMVPRMGQVVDQNDITGQGRVKVAVPILGWTTPDTGIWCHPGSPNGIINPSLDDWVIINFIDGKTEKAVFYGQAYWMKNMIPKSYIDKNSQILFEGKENSIHVSYDETEKNMEIGNQEFQPSARLEDSIKSTVAEDGTYWAWLAGMIGVLTGWVIFPQDGGAALQVSMSAYIALNPVPQELSGKITSGSDQVKVGNK